MSWAYQLTVQARDEGASGKRSFTSEEFKGRSSVGSWRGCSFLVLTEEERPDLRF